MNNEQIAKWSNVELSKIEAWSKSSYFDDKNKLTCVTLKAKANKRFSEWDGAQGKQCGDSIDIGKEWPKSSAMVRGAYPYISNGVMKSRRAKAI